MQAWLCHRGIDIDIDRRDNTELGACETPLALVGLLLQDIEPVGLLLQEERLLMSEFLPLVSVSSRPVPWGAVEPAEAEGLQPARAATPESVMGLGAVGEHIEHDMEEVD